MDAPMDAPMRSIAPMDVPMDTSRPHAHPSIILAVSGVIPEAVGSRDSLTPSKTLGGP